MYEAFEKLEEPEYLINDIRKNYGQMIDRGATTCWEMYPSFSHNRANPDMLTRSHCHAWSAAPAYFFGRTLLGIKKSAPGWKKFLVHPSPCGLEWAKGSVPLGDNGQIDVSWFLTDEQHINIQVIHPSDIEVNIQITSGYTGEIERTTI